jgi:stage III sporulation protein AE
MYKKIMIIVTLFLLISCFSVAHAQESIEEEEKRNTSIEDIIAEQAKSRNVTDILDSLEEYSPDEIYRYFNGISFNDLFQDALTGRFTPDLNGLFKSVMDFMTYEIKKNLVIIVYVLIISIIYSVIASMADSSGVKGVKDITGTVCYGAIILIIVRSYMDTVRMTGTMIGDLSGLVMSVTPLMISLLAASGNVVGATTMSPVMMFYSQFCVVAAEKYFFPMAVSYGLTGMVKGIASELKLDKLCGLIKSLCMWPMGIMLTFFSFILTLQKSITAASGGLSAKLMKSLIGFVPVVGGKLSEATTTVMTCLSIVRTAAGSVIMIGIAGIAALPVLKTVVLALIYKAAAALCEIVSDKKYADVLESASGSLMLMAGISGVISIMFIIIIGIIVGTGNAALAIAS